MNHIIMGLGEVVTQLKARPKGKECGCTLVKIQGTRQRKHGKPKR